MINILLIIIASFAFIYLNLTLFLRLKRYSNNKKIISFISRFRNFSAYMMIIILSYVFIDMVVLRLLNHGYPSDHEQEYIQRIPSPYDMFSGRPNVRDHNSDGFRGTNEGGKIKSTTIWQYPNTSATNESGFTALPGGHCNYSNFSKHYCRYPLRLP